MGKGAGAARLWVGRDCVCAVVTAAVVIAVAAAVVAPAAAFANEKLR